MKDDDLVQKKDRDEGERQQKPAPLAPFEPGANALLRVGTGLVGMVIEVLSGGCRVEHGGEVVWCVPRGILKKQRKHRQRNLVAVGDRVRFMRTGQGQGVFEEVLPRRNKLTRPDPFNPAMEHVIASNLDQVLIVVSAQKPPLDREILDRYLVATENLNLAAMICVNKVDLEPEEGLRERMQVYSRMGYRVFFTSAVTGAGLDALKAALKDKTSVMTGYSGVGKSTLLNAIEPGLDLKVREVSEKTGQGKHTTVSVRLLQLSFGAYVLDTPGIREFGLWRVRPWEVPKLFRDFEEVAGDCRYPKCFHVDEPDCAVRVAVEEGRLDPVRYKSYRRILESLTGRRQR